MATKYSYGLGRRKAATARARLFKGKGEITINNKPALEYLSLNKSLLAEVTDPLALVNKQKEFDVTILVSGGGLAGQVDAIKLAISKALTLEFPDLRPVLKKAGLIKREWYVIDAASLPLGKLAVVIADKLMGKSKVTYTPHIDNGDYVIVLNAKNIQVTGNKMVEKMYYRHSGFPGGLTELKLEEIIEKNPAYAIKEAVKGMLPKNKLADDRLARLRVFNGAEHTHSAQNPKEIK